MYSITTQPTTLALPDTGTRSNSQSQMASGNTDGSTTFVTASQKLSQIYSDLANSTNTHSSSLSYYSASESLLTFKTGSKDSRPQKPIIELEGSGQDSSRAGTSNSNKFVNTIFRRNNSSLQDSAGFSSPDCISGRSLGTGPKAMIRKIRKETDEMKSKQVF